MMKTRYLSISCYYLAFDTFILEWLVFLIVTTKATKMFRKYFYCLTKHQGKVLENLASCEETTKVSKQPKNSS